MALADADVSQTDPVRKFLQALMHEARQAQCGVLVVSHSTKAARYALRRSDDSVPEWWRAARHGTTVPVVS